MWQSGVCSSLWKGASCPGLRFYRLAENLVGASDEAVQHSHPPLSANLKDKEGLQGTTSQALLGEWQIIFLIFTRALPINMTTSTSLQSNHFYQSFMLNVYDSQQVFCYFHDLCLRSPQNRYLKKKVCYNASNKIFYLK